MRKHRLEITLNDDELARLDAARGIAPRAAFLRYVLELGLQSYDRGPDQAIVKFRLTGPST